MQLLFDPAEPRQSAAGAHRPSGASRIVNAPRISLIPSVPPPADPRTGAVADLAATFAVASASDLGRAALERRFDRKFLLPAARALDVVAALANDYRVVLARDERLALYDTVYFDTANLRSYHDHRRGRRPRFKLRVRNYIDREISMLEYKEKTARGDTRKLRWRRPEMTAELTSADRALLLDGVPRLFAEGELVPQARTVFHRLMLVNARSVERATLDFQVTLERGEARRSVDSVVVVEVKDVGRGPASPLVSALRQHQARLQSFSKYCMAVALLGGERANTFRPSLRAIEGGR